MNDKHGIKNLYIPEQLTVNQVDQLIIDHPDITVIDRYSQLINELYSVKEPIKSNGPDKEKDLNIFREEYLKNTGNKGNWFYYPWLNVVVHLLPETDHYLIRTARNRDIIRPDEQTKLSKFKVGVAGLSVGSSVVQALIMSGGSKYLRIADADTIELTNLNRLRAGVHQLGIAKTTWITRWIKELDPYNDIDVFAEGINTQNVSSFIKGLDLVVDEIDDLAMKVQIREHAKKHKIPVLMATDAGDNVILDIERFDTEPNRDIFHGLLSNLEVKKITQEALSKQDWMGLALKVIDIQHAPVRMLESMRLVGREIAGVPQLGGTAMAAGSILAYAIRMITSGNPLKSGKIIINVEKEILEEYDKVEYKQYREKLLEGVKKTFNNA